MSSKKSSGSSDKKTACSSSPNKKASNEKDGIVIVDNWTLVSDNAIKEATVPESKERPAAAASSAPIPGAVSDTGLESRVNAISDIESFQLCFSDTTNSDGETQSHDGSKSAFSKSKDKDNDDKTGAIESDGILKSNVPVEPGMVVCIRGLKKVAWLNGELAKVIGIEGHQCKIIFLREELLKKTDSQPHYIDMKNVEPIGEICQSSETGLTSYVSKFLNNRNINMSTIFGGGPEGEKGTNSAGKNEKNTTQSKEANSKNDSQCQTAASGLPVAGSMSSVVPMATAQSGDLCRTDTVETNTSVATNAVMVESVSSGILVNDSDCIQSSENLLNMASETDIIQKNTTSNSNNTSPLKSESQSQTEKNSPTKVKSISQDLKSPLTKKFPVANQACQTSSPTNPLLGSDGGTKPVTSNTTKLKFGSTDKDFSADFASSAHYVFSAPGSPPTSVNETADSKTNSDVDKDKKQKSPYKTNSNEQGSHSVSPQKKSKEDSRSARQQQHLNNLKNTLNSTSVGSQSQSQSASEASDQVPFSLETIGANADELVNKASSFFSSVFADISQQIDNANRGNSSSSSGNGKNIDNHTNAKSFKGKIGTLRGLKKVPSLNGEQALIVREKDENHWEVKVIAQNFVAVIDKKNVIFPEDVVPPGPCE